MNLLGNYKDGRTADREYEIYHSMLKRCYNENASNYARYGGRGIRVCGRWVEDYSNFLRDMGRSYGRSLDRIDNDGDYSPENCRWATATEQARNRRSNTIVEYNGEEMTLQEACERAGIKPSTVCERVRKGMDYDDALTKPVLTHSEAGKLGGEGRNYVR